MSIPDDLQDIEQTRTSIRKMSDDELRKYGRAAIQMADQQKSHGNPDPTFQIQVVEARAEWRRRHKEPRSRKRRLDIPLVNPPRAH